MEIVAPLESFLITLKNSHQKKYYFFKINLILKIKKQEYCI